MLKRLFHGLAFAATLALPYAHEGAAAEMGYAPQISDERSIRITVILRNIRAAANTLDFEVALESHTQALNDDLAKSAVLIADGKQYLPLEWKGAPPGGHHRKGFLRFRAISPQPRSIELQVRLASDTSPRSFKWLLK